jgi:hypothetical protein
LGYGTVRLTGIAAIAPDCPNTDRNWIGRAIMLTMLIRHW